MTASEGLPLLQDRTAQAKLAQENHKRQTYRRVAIGLAIAIVLLSGAIVLSRSHQTESQLQQLEESSSPYAKVVAAYRESHDFDGVVQVRVNRDVVFDDWSGKADEEFDAPMTRDSIFPVGSNSKLFTAVSLYQLQERGLVNLTDPVNSYLDQGDFTTFGFPNQTHWCPRVAGAAPDSPCENITFVQLMHMGSGIEDALNCDNVDEAHCYRTADDLTYYKGSLAPYVGRFINDPLVFKPDTNYSYSNPNYYLLSYLVEKITGERFEKYLQAMIFDKIGLKDTYYDPYSGGLGIHKGYVQQYIHYYDQSSTTADTKPQLLATGTCSPYMISGATSGSGGLRSSVPDMQRWYMDLFDQRGTASKVLRPESIRMILERVNPVNAQYGQGIGVGTWRSDGWPTALSYCGGVKCAITCMGMSFPENNATNKSDDAVVVVSAFSNHMHYNFPNRSVFDRFRPRDVMFQPPADLVEVMTTDSGGAMELVGALVQVSA